LTEHVFAFIINRELMFVYGARAGEHMFAGFTKGEFIQMALSATFILALGYFFTFALFLLN